MSHPGCLFSHSSRVAPGNVGLSAGWYPSLVQIEIPLQFLNEIGADIHGVHRMNTNDFSEKVT